MKWIVDAKHPPPSSAADHWVRCKDPWHRDAFPYEYRDAAPSQAEARGEGWIAESWCGNPEQYVPDGTEVTNGFP